ncbi:MAG: alcohol dehydrogenase catalytic domain-containing protein [Desulfobacterales bacterium]|nr:alcohol dehydrogenase catalytic domain-containing protein [Desulfobacterales bacterium]
MRAAVYHNNHDIRLEEMARPEPGPGELLVRIMASGICGSDVMEWYRLHKAPLVLGHEIAGQVVETGAGVTGFAVGDRVTATHHVPCQTCHYCLGGHETVCETLLHSTGFDPGGFCEYVRLLAVNVERGTWKLPDEVGYDEATFMEPLACVLRGQRRAGVRPGMSVLVLGSGLAGLLHVQLAAATGAGLVAATDLSPYRLEAARRLGADVALAAGEEVAGRIRELNDNRGVDLVIVCATTESVFTQAMEAVGRGGTILFFAPTMAGVTIPVSVNNLFWRRDVTITTSYAGGPKDCVAALELIRRGRVRVAGLISHRLGLADAATGFRLTAEARESIKVIIRPQE